jgi:hypothetical protein
MSSLVVVVERYEKICIEILKILPYHRLSPHGRSVTHVVSRSIRNAHWPPPRLECSMLKIDRGLDIGLTPLVDQKMEPTNDAVITLSFACLLLVEQHD